MEKVLVRRHRMRSEFYTAPLQLKTCQACAVYQLTGLSIPEARYGTSKGPLIFPNRTGTRHFFALRVAQTNFTFLENLRMSFETL